MSEPRAIRAGDTISWYVGYSDYPASDGWSLDYVIVGKEGGLSSISGVANGDEFDIIITAANSKTLQEGLYRLIGQVSKDDEKYTVYDEFLTVQRNLFETKSGTDLRTDAEIGLANIRAVINNRATKDQESYSIAGRSLSRTPIADLLQLEKAFIIRVNKERRAERRRQGKSTRRIIKTRFQ